MASGSLRLKTTVSLSGASMLFMFASSEEAPFGSAMSMLRSNENTTSSASTVEPSVKTFPCRILHSKVVSSLKSHDSAASGCGFVSPGGNCTRFW